jgi:cysteine desulfurase
VRELGDTEVGRIDELGRTIAGELSHRIDATLNGTPDSRTWSIVNLSVPGLDGADLARACAGAALANGSACTSGSREPSHVLGAMGIGFERARSAIRVSIGRFTTRAEVGAALDAISTTAEELLAGQSLRA